MPDVVQMDYEEVEQSAKGFENAGETLEMVNKVLDALLVLIRATAFIGLVGGAAMEAWIKRVQPEIVKASKMCFELTADLRQAVVRRRGAEDETTPVFKS